MVPLLYSEAPWWLSLSLRGKPPPFQRPSRSYTTWALANFLPPASASLPHSSTAATHRPTSCQCYLCAPGVLIRRVLALTAPSSWKALPPHVHAADSFTFTCLLSATFSRCDHLPQPTATHPHLPEPLSPLFCSTFPQHSSPNTLHN